MDALSRGGWMDAVCMGGWMNTLSRGGVEWYAKYGWLDGCVK